MANHLKDETGYELWLRYVPLRSASLLRAYRSAIKAVVVAGTSPTLSVAGKELQRGLCGLLDCDIEFSDTASQSNVLFAGTARHLPDIAQQFTDDLQQIGDEGYIITHHNDNLAIMAQTDIGVLYGVFAFLRLLQTHKKLNNLHIISKPHVKLRMLNHWDNLDGTIERGYAGYSLWDWHKLPRYIEPRYTDYARACASVGINATVLTNVNSDALVMTAQYLEKVAKLAEVFRPYGIKVYLTARFSAPIEIGGLETADPFDSAVRNWWREKVNEIYTRIPDFGGFLVKANSEGQPGPHDYQRSHADGANMLAEALAPHDGVVIWRAFVYASNDRDDRFKQANLQLVPLDGTFHDNVLLQVKNGAIDFQPREPFHPLFGAMPQTPLMLEVQLTQEYLGCATHLVYLAPLIKETLQADTYCQGEGSTVAKVIDGSLDGHRLSGMAAVANIGDEPNWCGHPFASANWYAYGRLAWDYELSSEAIAEEWLRMTFSNNQDFVRTARAIMIDSREAVVEYMMPLGLHHLFEKNHHYGPAPWVSAEEVGRADWSAVYYHRADSNGIGFDRSSGGNNAVSLYHSPYAEQLDNIETCPEIFLLWFHHVPWDYELQSGRTLWDELCFKYHHGVERVRDMQAKWASLDDCVDEARFQHVTALLNIQEEEARWWRDACLLYFQTFSGKPIPEQIEQPLETLEHFQRIRHYYVPGIPERRTNQH